MDADSSPSRPNTLSPASSSSSVKPSLSPVISKPINLLRVIGCRIIRQRGRHPSLGESSDSVSSSSGNEGPPTSSEHRRASRPKTPTGSSGSNADQNSGSDSGNGSSGSFDGQTSSNNTSESSESGQSKLSIKGVFKRLSINARSQSAGRKARPKKTPKKILRSPVRTAFVKGISGLPTQRVPIKGQYYTSPRVLFI